MLLNVVRSEILSFGKRLIVRYSLLLRTKFVTKKEMNKCMAEIYDPGGIRTRAARLISQYQTTELNRILPNASFYHFRLFMVATGCPSERRPQKTVSCYGG